MHHAVLTLGDTEADLARGITALDNAHRAVEPASMSPRAVLDWDDIRSHSIRNAARNEYL